MDSTSGRSKPKVFAISSKSEAYIDVPFREFKVYIRFAQKDWELLDREAQALGYSAEHLLEKRLKQTVRTGNPIARIDHASDRRRFHDGYYQTWLPYAKYLIFAYLSLVAGIIIMEMIMGSGQHYFIFYLGYLISLISACFALLGFKYKGFMERSEQHFVTDFMIRYEIKIARASETLIWISLVVFSLSLVGRIFLWIFKLYHTSD